VTDIDLDRFFSADIDSAFTEAASATLPVGTYRWKLTKIEPSEQVIKGIPQKFLKLTGVNADTGMPLIRTWRLTDKDGNAAPVQIRMLGEGLIKAGIRQNIKPLVGADLSALPVIALVISERTAPDGKTYQDQNITKADDQSVKEAADATPF